MFIITLFKPIQIHIKKWITRHKSPLHQLLLMKFKNHFKSLNYYSIPSSILFILRKRLNFIILSTLLLSSLFLTLF